MRYYELFESRTVQQWDAMLPRARETMDGLAIDDDIPNLSSISASFDDYKILKGIRLFDYHTFGHDFDKNQLELFHPDTKFDRMLHKPDARIQNLMDQISHNKMIKPLIVAIDQGGPYILEGQHRFEALLHLKIKTFPALVVISLDDENDD